MKPIGIFYNLILIVTFYYYKVVSSLHMLRILTILLFVFAFQKISAQLSSWRVRQIFVENKNMQLDSFSLVPGTLTIYKSGEKILPSFYSVSEIRAEINFNIEIKDTLLFRYQVFPYDFGQRFQIRDTSKIFSQQKGNRDLFLINTISYSIQDVFGGKELNKNGSISRGVNFGNNQNLGINSSLNLELAGDITPNLKLLASVSDAKIPIQPDGNTNKLQEFDQLFIQVYNDKVKLIAGDFWLERPKGYFLTYKKRGQGLTSNYNWKDTWGGSWKTQESVALSKGKFNRQLIQGKEANQGPYRLIGADNEPFIIVLSGTERVYIDGKLLDRGQDRDYTIDYNSSELVFTTRNMITKDSRIVVEFQYSDQSYARSLLQSSTVYSRKGVQAWLNVYQEADAKNQNLQQELNVSQKSLLGSIGDSINLARVSSINNVGYIENQLLYSMVDSLGYDSVLVFSKEPSLAVYRAYFQYVGPNKGDYIFDEQLALGKTYKWVAPISGVSQGDYAPSRQLITPKLRRLVSSGSSIKLDKNNTFESEFAASQYDVNTFSSLNDKDDIGQAGKVSWTNTHTWKKDSAVVSWKNSIETEWLSKTFTPIEQFRTVEFDRDWNVRGKNYVGNQLLSQYRSSIESIGNGKISLIGQYYQVGDQFNGKRLFSEGNWKQKGWTALWDASYLNSKSLEKSGFLRHRANLSKNIGKINVGFKDDQEHNIFSQQNQLKSRSYAFYDYQFYLSNGDTTRQQFKIFYRERYDWRIDSLSQLKKAAKAVTSGLEYKANGMKRMQITSLLGWRRLNTDTTLIQQTPENTAIGRIDMQFKTKKGDINFNTFYEIGSGLEQKRDFVYIKVNDGQGVYTWIDYDGDGIEDLNEFEIAQFIDQASYIRVFTPSSQYTKTFNNEFNAGLFWKPERRWENRRGFLKAISLFSDQTRFRVNKKVGSSNWSRLLNPIDAAIESDNLISTNSSIKNSLFFNRISSIFSAEYTISQNQTKNLLASGYDAKSMQTQEIHVRWNILRKFTTEYKASIGNKVSAVDYTQNRNYSLSLWNLQAECAFQPSTSLRYGMLFRKGYKQNKQGLEELSLIELNGNAKWNQSQKGSFQGELKYIKMSFLGNAYSAVGFDMLEALQPGNNVVWNFSYQYFVSKNLQISFQYLGRRNENARTIHTGGMELRAFF